MSELKRHHINEVMDMHNLTRGKMGYSFVYYADDADKVIAGLQEKLKEQTSIAEEGWKEFRTYHTSYAEAVRELYEKNKELRHQKYKRCLAMFLYLRECYWRCENHNEQTRADWYNKWMNVFQKLAEKFKEGKVCEICLAKDKINRRYK